MRAKTMCHWYCAFYGGGLGTRLCITDKIHVLKPSHIPLVLYTHSRKLRANLYVTNFTTLV